MKGIGPLRRHETAALNDELSELGRSIDRTTTRTRTAIALGGCGAVVPLFDLENSALIVLLMLVASLFALLDLTSLPAEGSGKRESHADLLLVVVLSILDPSLWFFGCIGIQGGLAIHCIRLPSRDLVPLASLNIISMAVVGAAINQPWPFALMVMPAVTWSAFEFGRDLRRALANTRQDLNAALSATGAIAHLADAGRNSSNHVRGDVERVTGWSAEDWTSMDHRDIVHPDDLESFWIDVEGARLGQQFERTGRMRRPDGSYRWIRDISRVELGREGTMVLRGLSFDVTDLEEANQRLRHQARHDELTGLFNRSVLSETMDTLLEAGSPFGLLMLDMNRFKEINDTLGHQFGDDILCEQAQRLTATVRPGDVVVRLGGDEFAVVAAGIDNEAPADELARRIAARLAQPLTLNGVTVAAPVSTGVVVAHDSTHSAGTLLRRADIAMYEAKRIRAAVRFFTDELERASEGDATLGAELVDALDNHHIKLHFQPKIDLWTGAVTGAEGLARWEHPTRGLLHPDAFLHLLDVSEAHRRFADQMIEEGVAFAHVCRDLGQDMQIAVNVSVRSLQDRGFATRVLETLTVQGVEPACLILEVTEQDLHDRNESVHEAMRELADAGVEFSIDDFGTGFSSLERLRDLAVHELKIDRTFVERALVSSKDSVIASTIITLADQLGHRVVAEGVEEEEQAELLRSLGCVAAQGHLYGRAMSVEDFASLLARAST